MRGSKLDVCIPRRQCRSLQDPKAQALRTCTPVCGELQVLREHILWPEGPGKDSTEDEVLAMALQ